MANNFFTYYGGAVFSSPDELGSLNRWYDASDVSTKVIDSTLGVDTVNVWLDKGLDGVQVQKGSKALQPENNVNPLNGLETINFFGSKSLNANPIGITFSGEFNWTYVAFYFGSPSETIIGEQNGPSSFLKNETATKFRLENPLPLQFFEFNNGTPIAGAWKIYTL